MINLSQRVALHSVVVLASSAMASTPLVPIREIRKAYGYTLNDLADRIAAEGVTVTPEALSNVERGNKKASNRLLHAWARALRLPPLDVIQSDHGLEAVNS